MGVGETAEPIFIFSDVVAKFIIRLEEEIKFLLKNEVKVKLIRNGFIFRNKQGSEFSIRYQISLFEGRRSELAYFDSSIYRLAFNKVLIYKCSDELLRDIIRHELAHFFTFLYYRDDRDEIASSPHGALFLETCFKLGWNRKSVTEAASPLLEFIDSPSQIETESEKVLEKVYKLFSLATSSNEHEAETALLKANQLLIRHQLDRVYKLEPSSPIMEESFMMRILTYPRSSIKLNAISKILKSFYVSPIFVSGTNSVHLEVVGSRTNVKLANYVASYLDRELEEMWKKAKSLSTQQVLKGLRAKNSFMMGVATGYLNKVQSSMAPLTNKDRKELILLEAETDQKLNYFYNRYQNSSSRSYGVDRDSHELGKSAGKALHIHTALEGGHSNSSRKGDILYFLN